MVPYHESFHPGGSSYLGLRAITQLKRNNSFDELSIMINRLKHFKPWLLENIEYATVPARLKMKSNCTCHRLVWCVPSSHWWYLRELWYRIHQTHGHRRSPIEDGTKRYPQWPVGWVVRLHCFSCFLLLSTMHFISRRPTYGTLICWKAYLRSASVASKCQHCTFCFFPPPSRQPYIIICIRLHFLFYL